MSVFTIKPLITVLIIGTVLSGMSGCSRFNVKGFKPANGSLNYQQSRSLPPLILPAGQSQLPVAPLYPVPDPITGFDQFQPTAGGKRFVLPVPVSTAVVQTSEVQDALGRPDRPLLVNDGNGYPLLRTEGSAAQAFELMQQAARQAGLAISGVQADQRQLSLTVDGKRYWLRSSTTGAITQTMLQDNADQLTEPAVATRILSLIQQNWPQQ